jgi:hypothetical protein
MTIVGSIFDSANVFTPVTWADADPLTPPIALNLNLNGAIAGVAYGINSLGQIVGSINDGANVLIPVTWANADPLTPPTALNINLNGVIGGRATGINTLGQIVGYLIDSQLGNTPVTWANADPLTPPIVLNFNLNGAIGGAALGINTLGQIVGSIYDSADVAAIPVSWADADPLTVPIALNLNLNGAISGVAFGINDPPTPTPLPMSNICFPAGTPIKTDQGIVNIESLDKHTHTINKQTILHITQTVTLDKYLIKFERHALSRNYPTQKTIMTKDHQIEFEGRLVPAYRFLDYSDQVKKVTYNGETLYNVLLATHGTMVVNNLVCETLHPDNIIAKLYTTNYTVAEKHDIIRQLNTALVERDLPGYKKIIQKLHTF